MQKYTMITKKKQQNNVKYVPHYKSIKANAILLINKPIK